MTRTTLVLVCVVAAICAAQASTAKKTVAVLGSGVGGLTAAHELAQRGFEVTVYETMEVLGGKARSIPVSGSGVDGRPDLPGEHGFRFFPGMYKHLPDTMGRIPFAGKDKGVVENLVVGDYLGMFTKDSDPLMVPSRFPTKASSFLEYLKVVFKDMLAESGGMPKMEVLYFLQRCMVMVTSCDDRWEDEFEKLSYWDFMHASELSEETVKILILSATRSLVACKADKASLRTVGRTFIRLLYTMFRPGLHMDSLLNGPTNDQFLTPWIEHLRDEYNVQFLTSHTVTALHMTNGMLSSVTVDAAGTEKSITADYYFLAIPVEKLAPMVTADIAAAAPSIATLDQLSVEWMNGIQFYLNKDQSIVKGHAGYMDSPWALTSVSQHQFWDKPITDYGDGTVEGIISVDISDWNQPGEKDGPSKGKPAKKCTKQEVIDEVWYQLATHKGNSEAFPLDQSNVKEIFIDPDVHFTKDGPVNIEPLLINTVNSLKDRPEAWTEIPNLFLASDYVRTETDLACMEASNEAARHGVNKLLKDVGRDDFAPVYHFDWPSELNLLRSNDCRRYKKGKKPLGWDFPVPKRK